MVFGSPIFICAFLPATLALYFLLPRRMNNAVLVAASIAFYAWGDPVAAILLVIPSIAVNFYLGRLIGAAEGVSRRRLMIAALALNLGVLIAFKYASFIVTNVNALLSVFGLPLAPAPEIPLPLGISFVTFHVISYLVDVYRGAVMVQPSLAAFALYILNFPQLIAGPIIRYRQIVSQLGARTVDYEDIEYGVLRFIAGLAKKLLIADPIGAIATAAFAMPPEQLTAGAAWIGVACYALQIYFDFSGYSDMAIGLARMFGFRFPENFNYPYAATSIQEFWRRWHMTLSAWFRDYVYIPLGGSRNGRWATWRNLWIVFFLTGAWHGASWNFIVWGLWHGLFLALERTPPAARALAAAPRALANVYVVLVVLVGWVFFRAVDLGHAGRYLGRMLGLWPVSEPAVEILHLAPPGAFAIVALLALFAFPLWPMLKKRWWEAAAARSATTASLVSAGYVAATMILCFAVAASQDNSPFLYFRF